MRPHISVPIPTDVYNEFVLRSGGSVDVPAMITEVLNDFLVRTQEDRDIWSSSAYLDRLAAEQSDERRHYGDPAKGYDWAPVWLPNGTHLRTVYKEREGFAEVRHERLWYGDTPVSPSEFASRFANNTVRNAWRDIWVKRPADADWIPARQLREAARSAKPGLANLTLKDLGL